MLFAPILTAIEGMLSTADSTKNSIKAYRQFTLPELGTWATPLCVLGPDLDIEPNLSGYGPTILRNRKVDITIHLLERSYEDVHAQHKAAVTALDTLQHNVCNVLEADPTLSDSVAKSKITRLQLQRYDEEYFEFIVTLTVDTKLE